MIAAAGFYFAQPWWLLAAVVVIPVIWIARRSLAQLSGARRATAVVLRVLVVLLPVILLARPTYTRTNEKLTVIAVVDRSRSIPDSLHSDSLSYLDSALAARPEGDLVAVVDTAETALIRQLPSTATMLTMTDGEEEDGEASSAGRQVARRAPGLDGGESRLADGVQMALAIASPETANRILLVSDGNETSGDLAETARVAAANGISIDVLPLSYAYDSEVLFKRLVAPARARSGQTVPLRFVLQSTGQARGELMLTLNGKPVDLDPSSPQVTAGVELKAGTNVKTVSLPIGLRGVHEFEAAFLPAPEGGDRIPQNNRAAAVTFVAGPGHVLVVSESGDAPQLVRAFEQADIDVRQTSPGGFPSSLTGLLDAEAVVLVDTPNHLFTYNQQALLARYVTELGGGLMMVGGPRSFGAGGWIGSELAGVLPVDPDPPQKKQMPRGALVLIMHACEMPNGNYWGKQVAIAAVNALSRLDFVGVLDYSWESGNEHWVYPFGEAGDKTKAVQAIKAMQMGDMPQFGPPMQAAYDKLKPCNAGQKHVIIISDGDPAQPSQTLLNNMRQAGITCTGVAVFPHSPRDVASLQAIAATTGGRFYNVKNPKMLPQIFIKEAQVVRRSLIVEDSFTPRVAGPLSETIRGLSQLPKLDGYVLTGAKGGLCRVVLTSDKDDPILATGQFGLGRSVAFTSSADSRWASSWLAWGGNARFWEQTVRWVSKSPQGTDCEIYTDVQGRDVDLTVEMTGGGTAEQGGESAEGAGLLVRVIAPDAGVRRVPVRQVGTGQFRGSFRAEAAGSYLVNVHYGSGAEGSLTRTSLVQSVVNVPYAPEFENLTDNASLLADVARITGGRVLPADPAEARLFDHQGLTFPAAALPLTKPLLLIWVALFLLDVAARRIAVDFAAIARKARAAVGAFAGRFRGGAKVTESLRRLKARSTEVRKKLAPGSKARQWASRRYDAAPGGPEEPQLGEPAKKPPPAPAEKEQAKPPPAPAEPQADETHVQRLLRVKRKRRSQTPEKDNE